MSRQAGKVGIGSIASRTIGCRNGAFELNPSFTEDNVQSSLGTGTSITADCLNLTK